MSHNNKCKPNVANITGYTIGGDYVQTIVLTGADGMQASILTLGARLLDLCTADGRSVILGYETLHDVENDDAYTGAVVGRVANRIGNGCLRIDSRIEVHLERNERDVNHVHGGPNSWDKRLFNVCARGPNWVQLYLFSPHGEQRYPSAVDVYVRYELSGGGALKVDLTTRNVGEISTVTNMTLHPYFDLSGCRGKVKNAAFSWQIHAPSCGRYLPLTKDNVPTGKIADVASTLLDFRTPRLLGKDLEANGGCDSFLVMDDSNVADSKPARHMITVQSDKDRLRLDVHSNQPGFQFYTANGFDGSCPCSFEQHGSVAIEPSGFIDACNHDSFPSIVLEPGQSKTQSIYYIISSTA